MTSQQTKKKYRLKGFFVREILMFRIRVGQTSFSPHLGIKIEDLL